NANGTGYAAFTFKVRDDGGTANGGIDLDPTANTITVDVTSVNDAPAGADAPVTTHEDTTYTLPAADFGFSDNSDTPANHFASANDAPDGADKTVATNEDTSYTLQTADFGFTDTSDTPANHLAAVKITTLATHGTLRDDGVAVTVGQVIAVADISANKLTFDPVADANGSPYATFTFQVKDDGGIANGGVDLDPSANTITVNVRSVNDAPAGAANPVATDDDSAYAPTTAALGCS